MTKLYLYTAFHFNLAFSSIPEEQYASVIDTCYWPILELLETFPDIGLGIEFTGDTLEKINQIDYTFIQKLKEFEVSGRCEIIGAGVSQAIFPLIPQRVNIENLNEGNKIYEKYFGRLPRTVYVNEQTFSNGLAEVYAEAGYDNVFMEFENSRLFNDLDKKDIYSSHKLSGLNIVWNSSISFQKFQRYSFGHIPLEEYINYVSGQWSDAEDRAFLLYGSDAEVFDYKPGNYDGKFKGYSGKEMERIYALFEKLSSDGRFKLVTPSYAADHFSSGRQLVLGTPENPVVCKKQPKYNAVRWAVSGREDTKMNTECTNLYRKIALLENMGCDPGSQCYHDLCLLWGSDYRTKTTEPKMSEYHYLMGKLRQQLNEKEAELYAKQYIEHDFIVINPNREEWTEGCSYQFEVEFSKQELFEKGFDIELSGCLARYQLDDVERYRDSSIRRCKLIIMLPSIGCGQVLQGRFVKRKAKEPVGDEQYDFRIKTGMVDLQFSQFKKGTIERLGFPAIEDKHAIGLVPHGYFDDIRYSTDLFSGHTIIRDRSLKQITDLDNSDMTFGNGANSLRIPVKSKIKGSFGELWKIYYIYRFESRVDIEYNFRFNDLNPIFFRTGILTFNPEFFNKSELYYNTANGGNEEGYKLEGHFMDQSEQVSLDISANGCLGATEGWVDFQDDKKGIAVYHDNGELYGVPMLTHREIEGRSYLRLLHSISETDDSGSIFWRGHSRFKMSVIGYKNEDRQKVIRQIRNRDLGLVLLQRRK